GVHTFSNGVTLVTAGSQTITATDTVNGSATGSAFVLVSAAGLDHLGVSGPESVTAGSPFSVAVRALDVYNNVVTGYTGTVHFTTSDPGSGVAMPGDYSFTSGHNGVHTFSNAVALVTAGNQGVTATDTGSSSV